MECAYSSEAIADPSSGNRQQRSPSSLQLSDDIRTRSIEKTLLPLLSQINTLVSSRGGSQSPANQQQQQLSTGFKPGSVAQQHAARVGLLVAAAADKFVAVGESLAEEYPDAALEMREACNEVQTSALELRRLTDFSGTMKHGSSSRGTSPSRSACANQRNARELSPGVSSTSSNVPDSLAVVSTSRQLLSSITKVLLLADRLCVKQILVARDRVSYWLHELENVSSRPTAALAEFVATFSELGRALVELAHLSGDRQADLRLDKDREALAVSRATLERGTQLLLAAAKTCLRHPESVAAAKVRDSILRMMRQALNSVGQTLNDTVSGASASTTNGSSNGMGGQQGSAIVPQSESDSSGGTGDSGFALSNGRTERTDATPPLRELVANVRSLVDGEAFSLGPGSAAVRRLDTEINRLADALQDFTDCAYTPHASRERLLGLLDRLRSEASQIAEQASQMPEGIGNDASLSDNDSVRLAISRLSDIVAFLQTECQRTADQLASASLENRAAPGKMSRGAISRSTPDVGSATDSSVEDYSTLINQLEYVALSGDQTAFRCSSASFEQRADLAIESARLFRHVAPTECLLMDAEHILAWLRLIAAAILASAHVLFEQFPNPVSRVSRESFRSFATAWIDVNTRLLATLATRCSASNSQQQVANNQSPGITSEAAGLFASPTTYSPPQLNFPQNSPLGGGSNGNNTFCSAESLSNVISPPNGYPGGLSFRQSSLPRPAARGMMGVFSPSQQQQNSLPPAGGRSASSINANTPTGAACSSGGYLGQTGAAVGQGPSTNFVRRSGSQPSLMDHLRQLRRHAENLAAMDGAVAAFSTGNGPLNSTADLMLQAQFVAEQARTICRLSTTTACQLPSTHGLRDSVLGTVEKALAATGRLEAVLAMPPPIVPTAPYQSQAAAGISVKNERVIASCHAVVVSAGNVVNTLLQSSVNLPDNGAAILANEGRLLGNAYSQSNISQPQNTNGRIFMGDMRGGYPQSGLDAASFDVLNDSARRGRRPWYSRSAANLAPTGAHPLSIIGSEYGMGSVQPQHQHSQRL